ncbi:MAG: outer membrane protein, partial [Pseudolabrys sp.]
MWRGVLAGAFAVALAIACSLPARAADASGAYDWTGFYAGVNAGAAFGSYDPTTAAALSPTYLFKPVDVAAVNAAGKQRVNPLGFIDGVQAGYNRQFGPLVIGVEGDVGYLHLNGAANSGGIKYPGGGSGYTNGGFSLNQFVISSYVNADWMATLRPRLGVASGNWLFYVTGGVALTKLEGEFLFTDGNATGGILGAAQEADVKSLRAGYIVGGGVETAVGDRLRLKAEYAFVNFGTVQAQETSQNFQCCFPAGTVQTFKQSMKLSASLVRVGLNYSFAASNSDIQGAPPWLAKFWLANLFARQEPTDASTWEFDVGTRTWFSSGTVGAPNPLLDFPPLPSSINSRLTYQDLHAWSGESFARADHISGFFVKGFLGAGGITSGTLVDEDFPGFGGAYSNTVSPLSGHLGYANIDFGYTFLKAPGAKVGAFVGYNYFSQHINGFGCTQVAGDTT